MVSPKGIRHVSSQRQAERKRKSFLYPILIYGGSIEYIKKGTKISFSSLSHRLPLRLDVSNSLRRDLLVSSEPRAALYKTQNIIIYNALKLTWKRIQVIPHADNKRNKEAWVSPDEIRLERILYLINLVQYILSIFLLNGIRFTRGAFV